MTARESTFMDCVSWLTFALLDHVMHLAIEAWFWISGFAADIFNDSSTIISIAAVGIALNSLRYTRKAHEINIRNNRSMIMRDRMIGAMNNVISYVNYNGDYNGSGMFVAGPIKDRTRDDMMIISMWRQIPAKPDNPGGNHHFVFTYRIFFGSDSDLNEMMNAGHWSDTSESVTIHLIRIRDGSYTLTDRISLKNYDEFTSEGRTIYLEDRNYEYVMMALDLLVMWNFDKLKKHEDELNDYNKKWQNAIQN